VHSREDDHAHLNNAAYLQGALGGAVDVVVLDDSYHMVTLDRERHVVVERTREFVERIVKQVQKAAAKSNLIDLHRAAEPASASA
jgi:carboxylesterase